MLAPISYPGSSICRPAGLFGQASRMHALQCTRDAGASLMVESGCSGVWRYRWQPLPSATSAAPLQCSTPEEESPTFSLHDTSARASGLQTSYAEGVSSLKPESADAS